MKARLFEQARAAEQRGNREGRDLWQRYAGHREKVTAATLALAPASGQGRVCLLGAGNANDYDLDQLAGRYAEIHLVDIDDGALARAIARQSPATRARLTAHAPVDLSGLYAFLDQPAARRPPADAMVAAGVANILASLPSGFDVVVSACVMSQMSWALTQLGAPALDPAELPGLEQSIARVHLRTLVALTAPGGATLLIADLVSTASYPLDELPADADLGALVARLAQDRAGYAVSNPELLKQLLRRDTELRAKVARTELGAPWLWTGSKDLTYLVYPMRLHKA